MRAANLFSDDWDEQARATWVTRNAPLAAKRAEE
jgi:hypothetical protein